MKALAYTCFGFSGFFVVIVTISMIGSREFLLDALALALVPAVFGVGFLVLAPRFTSRIPTPIRVVGFVVGFVAFLFGMAWASYVEIYGVGANYMLEESGDAGRVVLVDEEAQRETVVFEGTVDEAEAYIEDRQASGGDTTVPHTTAAVGGLITLAAMGLGWRKVAPEDREDRTVDDRVS